MREYAHPNLGRLLTPRHFPRLHETISDGWPVAVDNDCFGGYRPEAIARLFAQLLPLPSELARLYKACPVLWDMPTEVIAHDGTVLERYWQERPTEQLPAVPPNLLWVAVPDVVRCACGAEEHCPKERRGQRCGPRGDAEATLERFALWHTWISHLPLAFVLQDGSEQPGMIPWDAPGLTAVFVGGSDEWKLGPEAARLVREARARGLYAHMGRVNSEKRIQYAMSIGCTSVDGTGWVTWRRANLPRGLRAIERVRERPVHWQTRLPV
jgi:diadenosine tetraphosphatase ApaH/serine/threonine PP2A family protein phosphatase